MQTAQLPQIDEHATDISASADAVWNALIDTLEHDFSRAGAACFARAVGCVSHTASGPRPLAEGSTVTGFRIAAAVPGTELVLEGGHRYSEYALTFRLDDIGADRTRLRAVTRAVFPGVAGGVYRLLVIGTGAHVVAVRRMLSTIKRRSELR
jgi:hypothetical protein